MNSQRKKRLSLSRETVRGLQLGEKDLHKVAGAVAYPATDATCGDFTCRCRPPTGCSYYYAISCYTWSPP